MVRTSSLSSKAYIHLPPLVNPKNGKPAGMIAKDVYDIVMANAETLDSAIIYERDFTYNLCVC